MILPVVEFKTESSTFSVSFEEKIARYSTVYKKQLQFVQDEEISSKKINIQEEKQKLALIDTMKISTQSFQDIKEQLGKELILLHVDVTELSFDFFKCFTTYYDLKEQKEPLAIVFYGEKQTTAEVLKLYQRYYADPNILYFDYSLHALTDILSTLQDAKVKVQAQIDVFNKASSFNFYDRITHKKTEKANDGILEKPNETKDSSPYSRIFKTAPIEIEMEEPNEGWRTPRKGSSGQSSQYS